VKFTAHADRVSACEQSRLRAGLPGTICGVCGMPCLASRINVAEHGGTWPDGKPRLLAMCRLCSSEQTDPVHDGMLGRWAARLGCGPARLHEVVIEHGADMNVVAGLLGCSSGKAARTFIAAAVGH